MWFYAYEGYIQRERIRLGDNTLFQSFTILVEEMIKIDMKERGIEKEKIIPFECIKIEL